MRGGSPRAGFYPYTDERFWLVHGIIKTHAMAEGIQDVQVNNQG